MRQTTLVSLALALAACAEFPDRDLRQAQLEGMGGAGGEGGGSISGAGGDPGQGGDPGPGQGGSGRGPGADGAVEALDVGGEADSGAAADAAAADAIIDATTADLGNCVELPTDEYAICEGVTRAEICERFTRCLRGGWECICPQPRR